jgi:2-alkyl-3-oxoalkanoate reductase
VTVLVTGAAGFLGSHLTNLLLAQGERPRVLVRPDERSSSWKYSDVDVHQGDIADRAIVESAMVGVESVLHCAARTGPWGPEREYQRTNVQGLRTLVRTAIAAGVRRIVHVSSITVHGDNVRGAADETAPICTASNPYSRSKVAGERLLLQMIHDAGAPLTIVRPGLIYGPGDAGSFARFATLIDQRKMVLIGSGRNHMPLIYVTDAAEGILLASTAEHAAGKVYLLVNDEPVTQCDYLNAIAAGLGRPPVSRRIPYGLAFGIGMTAEVTARLLHRRQPPPLTRFGVQVLGGENRFMIRRARSELAFQPRVGLAEGVSESIAWYRKAFVANLKPHERELSGWTY